MSRLKQVLKDIEDLPAMPEVAVRLVRMTANLDTDISEIIKLIEKDPSLTAKLLRLCNSPYYGIPQKISSLQQAVVLLGYTTLYKIALTLSSSIYFKKGAAGYGMSVEEIWRHSVGTAIACEVIAHKVDRQKAKTAYVAGLLHDIGKIVISQYIQKDIEKILELTSAGKPFIEAETEVIGMDHAMIAGRLARQWKLPECLIEAIKYHHEPHLAASDKSLCAITHLGNAITSTIGVGLGIDSYQNKASEDAVKMYPLEEADLDEIVLLTHRRVGEAEDFINQAMIAQSS